MKLEIRAGKTAPCELVNEAGEVIAEGTNTHCQNVKREKEQRWLKVPNAGEFRGEGTWKKIEEISCPVSDWEWHRITGYLPTYQGTDPQ